MQTSLLSHAQRAALVDAIMTSDKSPLGLQTLQGLCAQALGHPNLVAATRALTEQQLDALKRLAKRLHKTLANPEEPIAADLLDQINHFFAKADATDSLDRYATLMTSSAIPGMTQMVEPPSPLKCLAWIKMGVVVSEDLTDAALATLTAMDISTDKAPHTHSVLNAVRQRILPSEDAVKAAIAEIEPFFPRKRRPNPLGEATAIAPTVH